MVFQNEGLLPWRNVQDNVALGLQLAGVDKAQRRQAAAQMLKSNPDIQIAEISDQLGFGSPRYFSRCFKAQFNITPADYRKKEDKQS
ncbi:MAG: helix-turn-helix domain-containing protein [Parabacteroides chartae]|nr:helix-turn-helix domain-containing protein [Parabacteroides chartae]